MQGVEDVFYWPVDRVVRRPKDEPDELPELRHEAEADPWGFGFMFGLDLF